MPKVRSDYVSLYYDHYKDTFEQLKGSISKRDRLTLFLLLLAVLVALLSFDTERTGRIFRQLIEKEYGIREIGAAFIDTASILALTYITLAYYRVCLGIERLYVYLHNVEYTLSAYRTEYRQGKQKLPQQLSLSLIPHRLDLCFPATGTFMRICGVQIFC